MSWAYDGDGQTPLSDDDLAGLIPTWVATRGDLDEAEQENIAQARAEWLGRTVTSDRLLDDLTVRQLHRDMVGDVWRWAGRYRKTEMSIGADPVEVAQGVRNLVENARYWLQDADRRIALARMHHQIVAIHPFPNVNGRHGRLWVDLIARAVDEPVPTWLVERDAYLSALREVDATDNLAPLVAVMWT